MARFLRRPVGQRNRWKPQSAREKSVDESRNCASLDRTTSPAKRGPMPTTDDLTLDRIRCPKCGEVIPVSEALSHQVAETARAQLRAEAVQHRTELAAREQELLAKEEA